MHGVEAGVVSRGSVTEHGAVLSGTAERRRSPDEFAIQDLAVALAAMEQTDELDLPTISL